jgi:hypothetical protein
LEKRREEKRREEKRREEKRREETLHVRVRAQKNIPALKVPDNTRFTSW